jgi:PPOX class probable F420-dependent enzyme
MLTKKAKKFLAKNHMSVLTTHRKNGGLQMSIVTCGLYRDGVAFTTRGGLAKLANLRRDPRCALLVSKSDWWGYVVLDGKATILSSENTKAEELRIALRDVYRAAAGKEHPDWDDYDRAMVKDKRVVIIVAPERVYGMAT